MGKDRTKNAQMLLKNVHRLLQLAQKKTSVTRRDPVLAMILDFYATVKSTTNTLNYKKGLDATDLIPMEMVQLTIVKIGFLLLSFSRMVTCSCRNQETLLISDI